MGINLRNSSGLGLALLLSTATFAAEPPLRLSDPNLPLQEIRPLDRHVWVLSLDGAWKQPAVAGVAYHVNLIFPNGQSYSHRVLDDAAFRMGEVRCLVPDYQLARNGLGRAGSFTIVISGRRSVTSALADEVVSVPYEVRWPMNRAILRWPPRTRVTPPEPIDAFTPPGEGLPKPKTGKGKILPGEPPPVPD
jgi:hypothetical protein